MVPLLPFFEGHSLDDFFGYGVNFGLESAGLLEELLVEIDELLLLDLVVLVQFLVVGSLLVLLPLLHDVLASKRIMNE